MGPYVLWSSWRICSSSNSDFFCKMTFFTKKATADGPGGRGGWFGLSLKSSLRVRVRERVRKMRIQVSIEGIAILACFLCDSCFWY